jgi:hypothetical protein
MSGLTVRQARNGSPSATSHGLLPIESGGWRTSPWFRSSMVRGSVLTFQHSPSIPARRDLALVRFKAFDHATHSHVVNAEMFANLRQGVSTRAIRSGHSFRTVGVAFWVSRKLKYHRHPCFAAQRSPLHHAPILNSRPSTPSSCKVTTISSAENTAASLGRAGRSESISVMTD